MAAWPLNEVTDDPSGHGLADSLDRARYLAQMRQVAVGGWRDQM